MEIRQATQADLPRLKEVYAKIVRRMEADGLTIWDDYYPNAAFPEDIALGRLYLAEEDGVLVSAFALCQSCAGARRVTWQYDARKALYLYRFAVNADCWRQGRGRAALQCAVDQSRALGADVLRLFVVDVNTTALDFYIKAGFVPAEGVYEDRIADGPILREFGYEIKTGG